MSNVKPEKPSPKKTPALSPSSGPSKMGFRRVDSNEAESSAKVEKSWPWGSDFAEANSNNVKGIYRFDSRVSFDGLPVNEIIKIIISNVIGVDGKINMQAIDRARKMTNIKDARHNAHVHRILDLLKNDVNFRKLIENINAPENESETDTIRYFIKVMFQLGEDQEITKIHAQQAVLGAVMSDLRQHSSIGSCYGTAIAICVHDSIPYLMVKDLTEVLQKGYFTRKRKTKEGDIEEKFYLGVNMSLERELSQLTWQTFQELCKGLCAKYPDPTLQKIFFIAANNAGKISPTQGSFLGSLILETLDNAIKQHFEISSDDVILANSLKDLSQQINKLSVEASLNNDSALDNKVQELVNLYEEKVKLLGEKRFQLENCEKIYIKITNILYAEATEINPLTRSWEYAIMSAELRAIEREEELSFKTTPPALQEVFKQSLFSKDRGELFINEMRRVLNVLEVKKNILKEYQQNQVSTCLSKIVDTMKAIIDKRITVQTGVNKYDISTFHTLTYVSGNKFKFLYNNEDYTNAILGCLAEAFQEVMEQANLTDSQVEDFLIEFKGILSDELKSERFRNSVNSFLINTVYYRPNDAKANFDYIWNRVFSVYFNQEYIRQVLSIEKDNSIANLLQLTGPNKASELDREVDKQFDETIQFAGKALSIGTAATALIALGSVAPMQAVLVGLLGGITVTAGKMLWEIRHTVQPSSIKAKYSIESLTHYIEASRIIYKAVKNHQNWIKYPLNVKGHVCNLIPFNQTLIQIVESENDIEEYIRSAIKSRETTVIALMDTNYSESQDVNQYAGFELGGGSIKAVFLNSHFEVTARSTPLLDSMFSGAATIPVAAYHTIDEQINHYKKSTD